MTNVTLMKNVPSLSIPLYPFEDCQHITKGNMREHRSMVQCTLYMHVVERPIFYMSCDIIRIERSRNRFIVQFLLDDATATQYKRLERDLLNVYNSQIVSYCHHNILNMHLNRADIFVKGRKRESLLHLSHVRVYLEIPYCWYNMQKNQAGLKVQCKAIQRLSI